MVLDAQLIPIAVLDELLTMTSELQVRCRLLLSALNADRQASTICEHLAMVADRAGEVIDEDTFRTTFADRKPTRRKVAPVRPRLPRVDGTMFRSTCQNVLEPDHFADVDARFVTLVRGLRAEITAITGANKTRTFARSLKQRLAATPDTDALVLIVRAAQVAAVICGFHIAVNTTAMLGAEQALPRVGKAVSERWWEQLDSYRDPAVGASAALYSHGARSDELQQIRLGHIAAPAGDGSVTVRLDDGSVVVPGDAARFVTAQAAFRYACGADDDSFLFATHRASKVKASYSNALLAMPAGDLGVTIAVRPVRAARLDGVEWLWRYGIKISKLEKVEIGRGRRA